MTQATDSNTTELSVIILVSGYFEPIQELYDSYKKEIAATGLRHEIIFTLDGPHPEALKQLKQLQQQSPIQIITLSKRFGETTALNAAFHESEGDIILTLPAHKQIEEGHISSILEQLEDNDMVIVRRWPRKDSFINRLQTRLFNALLGTFSDIKIRDAGCGIRAFKRYILDEVQLYGDMFRFFPIMANRQGFRITEVDAPQNKSDTHRKLYSPGIYIRRVLDILSILFLSKFLKKPLRFFGLIGITLSTAGLFITGYLIVERLFFEVALSDRPALFLASLLIVLGIQIIAVGLIGELLVFTHAKDLKEYRIRKIIN